MSAHFRLACLALSLTLHLSGVASAIPVQPLDLSHLSERAQVIVVATLSKATDVGPSSIALEGGNTVAGRTMKGVLTIARTIKGSVGSQGLVLVYFDPDTFIGYPSLSLGATRLFFLTKRSQDFELTDPHYPSLVAATQPPSNRARRSDAVAAITSELAAVVTSTLTTEDEKVEAIQTLTGAAEGVGRDALRGALAEPNERVRLSAAAVLTASDDLTALSAVEEALLHASPTRAPGLDHNLRVSLYGLKAPGAAPSLLRLLAGGDVQTRQAASMALRRLKSPATIVALVAALDDADAEVRHNSVVALTSILDGADAAAPSFEAFKADESRYVRRLRESGSAR